jgi:hypothetical protein
VSDGVFDALRAKPHDVMAAVDGAGDVRGRTGDPT